MGLNYASFAINGSIRAYFLKEKFDSILVFQTSPVSMILPSIVVKHKQKIPLYVYCLDQWPISVTTGPIPEHSLFYKLLYHISTYHYKKADQILLSSKSFIHYFEDILKLPKEKYGLIYWPTYAEDVYGDSQYLENGVFDLVFAGNIGPAQSVETIIESAIHLKNNKNIHFHIVGDGLSLNICKKMAQDNSLSNVTFHGHHPVEAMKSYYDLADAFLITMVNNPVVNSTLPAKIQSYMKAGKPIIGAISGEVELVIQEAGCGWVGPSLNSTQLTQHIIDAYNQPKEARQKGQNGLFYYQKHFDKNKQLKILVDYLGGTQCQ
jgi:glycosyltransferase involved in cell wall biosynthesis